MRNFLLFFWVATLFAMECHAEHLHAHQKGKGGEPRDLPADRGAYVGPPRSGVEVGESTALGVRGLGLHFPAITLRLPTLTLPSLVKHRSRAHMLVEADVAPYVDEVAREEFGMDAGSRDFAPPPVPRDVDTPGQKGIYQKINQRNVDSPGDRRYLAHQTIDSNGENKAQTQELEYQRKLEELNRKLEECNKMSQLLQDTLRNQAAMSRPTIEARGQAVMGRLPSSALSQARDNYSRLPAIDGSRNGQEIQQASHWATTEPRREPALLERLPRDTMAPGLYPRSDQ
ncbi:MAG TPA: hypothetical protein VMM76_01665 [Pirellulaceae bacterium]|nr:hypothetical protein [Pirellulaceae bacterium]